MLGIRGDGAVTPFALQGEVAPPVKMSPGLASFCINFIRRRRTIDSVGSEQAPDFGIVLGHRHPETSDRHKWLRINVSHDARH